MNKIKIVLLFFTLVMCGCDGPKETQQKKMIGINGEAVYLLNKDGSIAGLFKIQYNTHDFAVLLINDTLSLGSEFVSTIYVTKRKHKVQITQPTSKVFIGDSLKNEFKAYRFKPDHEGVYDFQGIIEYDTTVAPFEYKFIVVKKD